MTEIFINYSKYIIFFHILSAIIWIGGMVAIRFSVHYAMQNISEPKVKLARTLEILKRFFNIVIPAIVLLIITAVFMAIGFGFKGTPLYMVVHIKEAIWTLMTAVFIYIYIKRNRAERAFISGDLEKTKSELSLIPKYLIPLNIILGLFGLYFGITLRGF